MEINYSCGLGIEHDLKPDEWADRGKVQAAFEEQLSHVSLTLHPDQQSAVLARVRRLLLTAEGVEELAERLLKNE
jgi:hypothetical protein